MRSAPVIATLLIIIGGLFLWEAYREDPAPPPSDGRGKGLALVTQW